MHKCGSQQLQTPIKQYKAFPKYTESMCVFEIQGDLITKMIDEGLERKQKLKTMLANTSE